MSAEMDDKVMADALARLIEQFDSVQIFATRRDNDGTGNFSIGSGDYFARFGIARQWVVAEEEKARELARRKMVEGDPGV